DSRSFLEVQDSVLQSSIAVVRDARTQVLSAANATHTPEGREAIAIEIESLRDQMVSLANTRFGALGLFAGFSSAAVAQAGGGAVTLEADGGEVLRRLGPSTTLNLSLDANELFGFDGGDDLFKVLSSAAASIRAGDTATLGTTTLQRIDVAAQALAHGIAQTGARANQITRLSDGHAVRNEQVRTQAGGIEFVDLAEATIEVAQAGAAYEAALAATAKLGSVSLLNFL
ncbi:MAG: flagellin, partial [Acidimicrobiales bacterium]